MRLWPPLVITLVVWPPKNWLPGLEMDWRLQLMVIGLLAVPAGLWLLATGRADEAQRFFLHLSETADPHDTLRMARLMAEAGFKGETVAVA